MKITELLDSIINEKGLKTRYELAKLLGIDRGLIYAYYKEKNIPNEYACLQIARALGKSYEEISALVQIAAEKNEKRKTDWMKYYHQIEKFAGSTVSS